jgi:exodeoxyribonuclease VII small subunit
MARTNKSPSSSDAVPLGLGFEEALGKLELLLEQMESEELPLELMLSKYEEGQKLVEICQARLSSAELRIQQIQKDSAGRITVKTTVPEPGVSDPESA